MAINNRKLVPKFLTQSRFSPVPQVDLAASYFHGKHTMYLTLLGNSWNMGGASNHVFDA